MTRSTRERLSPLVLVAPPIALLSEREHEGQVKVIAWAETMVPRHPELRWLHAVQNWAGVKSGREGGARKREGIKAGVPDLCLPLARPGYASARIEMKRVVWKDGHYTATQPTAEQITWLNGLAALGNFCAICWTPEDAQRVLLAYVQGRIVCKRA